MIPRRTVLCLGVAQLVCWGVSYHLIGIFGERIAADLGWSLPLVYGGLTCGLLVMGVASPAVGRMIDRHGGRPMMVTGSILTAAGCAGVAGAHRAPAYYAAWICLGLAMRLTLYEGAFAALARAGGPDARRPISQITLLGGLASTVFWPIGHALARPARLARRASSPMPAFALLTIPLHLTIPGGAPWREPRRRPRARAPGLWPGASATAPARGSSTQ